MTNFQKRKKFDLRKFINRTKNRFQRVRKFCRMHTLPVLVAVGIMVSVIFTSYQNAYATGLEEYFYYTYFDLMSGLFAETGMDFGLKDDYYTKSDRVSGKQVWDNFCTWVENKAKVAALPVEVVNKTVFDELKNLPNTVTSTGAKMSEKLSELLAKVLPTFASDNAENQFDTSSEKSVYNMLVRLMGCSDYSSLGYLKDVARTVANKKSVLSIYVMSGGYRYVIYYDHLDIYLKDGATNLYTAPFVYKDKNGVEQSADIFQTWVSVNEKSVTTYIGGLSDRLGGSWLIKNGRFVASDGTTINDFANVKTLHDGSVWVPGEGFKDSWAVWDAIKDNVTTDEEEKAWNSRYNFDNDNKDDKEKKKKDNEKDKLPVAIPIVFPNKKPDSTEKDSEKDSEKSTEDVAPGGKPKPGSSEKPDSTQKDTEKATDPGDIPPIVNRTGNWKRLFPFCIPWDMMSLIKSMKADKKAPVFEFKYTFKAVNYTWVIKVDMSDYWKYIKIFRWGMTIFFIIGLFFLTVKFTTFVYKMGS